MHPRTLRCLLFALLALFLTETAMAQGAGQAGSSREAAAIAVRQQPGKVLSVKRENGQFLVKVLGNDGKVRYVTVKSR